MRSAIISGSAILTAILSGCCVLPSSQKNHSLYAATAVSQIGLKPIFPFRQAMWIGDVYLVTDRDKYEEAILAGDPAPFSPLLNHLDLNPALDATVSKTPSFQTSDVSRQLLRKVTVEGKTYFLKPAAAPSYVLTGSRVVGGSLAAAVPGIEASAAGGTGGDWTYEFSTGDLMSIGVPTNIPGVIDRWGDPTTGSVQPQKLLGVHPNALVDRAVCRRVIWPSIGREVDYCSLQGTLVTEVFYVRQLAVVARSQSKTEFKAAASAELTASALTRAATKAVTSTVGGAVPQITGDVRKLLQGVRTPQDTVAKVSDKILGGLNQVSNIATARVQQALDPLTKLIPDIELPGLGSASASLQYVSHTSDSVTLKTTFDEPVAVGFRGMDFIVNWSPQVPESVTGTTTVIKDPPPADPS